MGLVHYFLFLEVWKGDGEIFVGQGKYITEILQKFHMQDCRPMATPLVTNWRKMCTTKTERVDLRVYMQLNGSFMYLVST